MYKIDLGIQNRNLFLLKSYDGIMDVDMKNEVNAIKSKLDIIHDDVKRFIERSNQEHLASILNGCRSDFSDVIIGYATSEINDGLEDKMVGDCQMKDACKALFSDLLKNNLGQIKEGGASEDSIGHARSKLKQMRAKAPYEQCENCFSEAARLLDKQIDTMRSLRVYRDNDGKKESTKDLPEEKVVSEILEPLSNRQRLQMMKALSAETKTFSALSQLTGLRGGNLIFHLQKLQEGGLILQRHERGDYMITEKGYRALSGISELYFDLSSKRAQVNREVPV